MKKIVSLILVVTMVFAAVPAALAESVGEVLSSAGAAVLDAVDDAYKAVVNAEGEYSLPLLESYTTCTTKTGVKEMDGFTDRPYAVSWENSDEGYRSGVISFDALVLSADAAGATLKLNVSRTQNLNENGITSTISVYAVDPEKVDKDNVVKPDDPDPSTKMGTISLEGLPSTKSEVTENNEVSVEINILKYRELYPNAKTIALMLSNREDIADCSSRGLVGFYGKDADEDYRPRLMVSFSDVDPSKVAEVTVKTVLSDGKDSGVKDIKFKVLAGQEYTYVPKSTSPVVVDGTYYVYNAEKSKLTITPKSEGANELILYYEKAEEYVLFDAADIDTSTHDDILLSDYGWTTEDEGVFFSSQWSETGTWDTEPWGKAGLMFFFSDENEETETKTAVYDDYGVTAGAESIVIDYTFAAQEKKDNHQRWNFLDIDGNEFATVYTDAGNAWTGYVEQACIEIGGLNGADAATLVSHDSEKVLALRGVPFRIIAVKDGEGATVVYSYDKDKDGTYEVITTESVAKFNGFKSITADIPGDNVWHAAMALQNLKITANADIAEVTVKTVLSDGTDSGVKDIKVNVLADQEYTYVPKSTTPLVVDGTYYAYNAEKSKLTITPKSEGANELILYYEKAEGYVNFITNGDFSDGLNGWVNRNDANLADVCDPNVVYYDEEIGKNVFVNPGDGFGGDGNLGTAWTVHPGKMYYLSFWVGGTKPTIQNYQYNVVSDGRVSSNGIWYVDEASNILLAFGEEMVDNEWTKLETTFVAETDTVYIEASWSPGLKFADFVLYEIPESSVTLTVEDTNGNKIASDYTVNWYEGDSDIVIANGNSLSGVELYKEYQYEIILDETLGVKYYQPPRTTAGIMNGFTEISVTLKEIPSAKISGIVRDSDGVPIANAVVNVEQTANGKFPVNTQTKTGTNGYFEVNALCMTAKVTVSVDGYYDNTSVVIVQNGGLDMGDIVMSPLPNTKIRLDLTLIEASLSGEEGIPLAINSFANLKFTVTNTLTGENIDFTAQYPSLAIDSRAVKPGDTLLIQAEALDGSMSPAETEVILDGDRNGSCKLEFKENGKILVTARGVDRTTVMIFDQSGTCVDVGTAASSYKSAPLPTGSYKVVFIKETSLLRDVSNFETFKSFDLDSDADYVILTADVSNGRVTALAAVDVPDFDESKLYYTLPEKTMYNSSSVSSIAGKLISMTAKYEFEDKTSPSGQTVIFEIPEGMNFVNNSLLVNGSVHSYTVSDGYVTVITNQPEANIKFYVMADSQGVYSLNALLSFTINGKSVTQPIGTALLDVETMRIGAPQRTAQEKITVNGSAAAGSEVTVYRDDEAVGTVTANSNGSWWLDVELTDHYLLNYYQFRAEAATPYGFTMGTDTVGVWYDANCTQVSKVTMYNGADNGENVSVFDFINPSMETSGYAVYPGITTFTFTIEFIGEADNVVLYVYTKNGDVRTFDAEYDPETGLWLVTADFSVYDSPTNVGVDYTTVNAEEIKISREELDDIYSEYDTIKKDIAESTEKIDTLSDELESVQSEFDKAETLEEWADIFNRSNDIIDELEAVTPTGEVYIQNEEINLDFLDDMSEEECSEYLKSIIEEYVEGINEMELYLENMPDMNLLEMPENMVVKDCVGLTNELLLADGFTKMEDTSGGAIYTKQTDIEYHFVDLTNNIYLVVTGEMGVILSGIDQTVMLMDTDSDMARVWAQTAEWMAKGKEFFENIYSVIDIFKDNPDELNDFIEKLNRHRIGKVFSKLAEDASKNMNSFFEKNPAIASALKNAQKKASDMWKSIEESRVGRRVFNETNRKFFGKVADKISGIISVFEDIYELGNRIYLNYWATPKECKICYNNTGTCSCMSCAQIREVLVDMRVYILEVAAFIAAEIALVIAEFSSSATGPGIICGLLLLAGQIVSFNFFKDKLHERADAIATKATKIIPCTSKDCGEDDDDPDPTPWPYPGPINAVSNGAPREKYTGASKRDILDPSGYVCEAVPSNRVEGVTATAYFMDDVLDDFGEPTGDKAPAVWNAADFDQTNPLITDANGAYAWDVPEGSWAVKFEKDGYVTAWSDWLPVPPPQTEVNIALVSTENPSVESVSAFGDKVRLVFTQYMEIPTVNTDTVKVNVGGKDISGTVTPADAEASFDDPNVEYARTFIFTPDSEISGTALVTVNGAVNYVGRSMVNGYAKNSAVVIEPKDIAVPESVEVAYGSGTLMEIQLMPGAAGAGHTVRAVSSSPSVVSVVNETAVTDENGRANIMLAGNLPGGGEITVTVDGTDISTAVKASVGGVIIPVKPKTAKVKSSVPSGTVLQKGDKVELSTDTDGAEIYYTLDNTDPVSSASRIRYTGPIEINEDTFIIAYAVKDGYEDSSTAGFTYTVEDDEIILDIDGWTDTDLTLIAAIYSAENKMLNCKSFKPSGTGHDKVVFELGDGEVAFVKVFEWSSLKDMTPQGKVTVVGI